MNHSVLDPAIAAILPRLPLRDAENATPERIRKELRDLAASRADIPLPELQSARDDRVAGLAGPIGIRIYRPHECDGATIVFLHGGGWVAGDLETHDRAVRTIARETGAVVIAVDYRRPPEAPFPAPLDDALAAFREIAARIDEFGGDRDRLGIAGDSAGGNLAAAAAITLCDARVHLKAQLLIYPAVDTRGLYRDKRVNDLYPSRGQNAEGYFLSLAITQWFASKYLPRPSEADDWRASPLHATDLSGVAPAVVCTATFDPLRDEGNAYAHALAAAGVPVRHYEGAGLIHGYFGMAGASPAARSEVERVCAAFKALLR